MAGGGGGESWPGETPIHEVGWRESEQKEGHVQLATAEPRTGLPSQKKGKERKKREVRGTFANKPPAGGCFVKSASLTKRFFCWPLKILVHSFQAREAIAFNTGDINAQQTSSVPGRPSP